MSEGNTPATADAADPSGDTSKLDDFSLEGASNYVLPRIVLSSAGASIYGASVGYYLGDAMVLSFYSYGLTFGLLGATFFGGNYVLRGLRKQDDVYNFSLSGSVSGGAVGALRGARRGAMGFVAGGLFGAAYKLSSDWVYATSRESWIQTRRFTLENSKPRILTRRGPAQLARESREYSASKAAGKERGKDTPVK
ncbi:hypothetical protein B484DRAFT_236761 [Ochromonadaceae sp. CCMP2298]|nr:hypothetical protein B484DRAFT_236761 [Ochromonadaceae sp. CCMP2298]